MGQQQVLLLVLVSILVGIATMIAINVFTESQETANREAVRIELMEAVSPARAYFYQAEQLGGGGRSFANIQMHNIFMDSTTANGDYSITNRSTDSFHLVGSPESGGDDIILEIYIDKVIWQ